MGAQDIHHIQPSDRTPAPPNHTSCSWCHCVGIVCDRFPLLLPQLNSRWGSNCMINPQHCHYVQGCKHCVVHTFSNVYTITSQAPQIGATFSMHTEKPPYRYNTLMRGGGGGVKWWWWWWCCVCFVSCLIGRWLLDFRVHLRESGGSPPTVSFRPGVTVDTGSEVLNGTHLGNQLCTLSKFQKHVAQ